MAKKNTMTQRIFLNAIINGELAMTIDNEEIRTPLVNEDGTLNEAVRAFAIARLAKLDADQEARNAKPSKAAQENRALGEKIAAQLEANKVYTAAQIAEQFGITQSKVTYAMKAVPELVVQTDVTIKPEGGHSKTVKGYTLNTDIQ